MKFVFPAVLFGLLSLHSAAQEVPKRVIVEHFTNTKCGICASRNPGFYTNLEAQDNVLHIAIHPSSPYNTCVFNTHNVADNDGRTNYYGVYGGTPRLVIQGAVISGSANYANSSLFAPYLNQTSPVSLRILQQKYGSDSIVSTVIIKTVASHTLSSQRLFVGLAEKTVNYNAPNGEAVHHDVFRKALTGVSGMPLTLPNVGDSLVVRVSSASNAAWSFSEIYAIAILQAENGKAVTQSAATTPSQNDVFVSTNAVLNSAYPVRIYPNPSTADIVVDLPTEEAVHLSIYSVTGTYFGEWDLRNKRTKISLNGYPKGVYLFQIRHAGGINTQKIVIQ